MEATREELIYFGNYVLQNLGFNHPDCNINGAVDQYLKSINTHDAKHLLAYSLPLDGDRAWDTISVLEKLVEAADILLHKKDYDGHGWEEIELCYKLGLEILQGYRR